MRYLVCLILAGPLVAETAVLREGSLLKLTIREPLGIGAHAVVNAELAAPVFDGEQEIIPAGAKLQLTSARVWKQRAPGRKRGVVDRILRPLDFSPRTTHMEIQQMAWPGQSPFPASVLRLGRGVAWLRVGQDVSLAREAPAHPAGLSKMREIPAGTKLNLVLVNSVHSALNRNDDGLRAVLLRPLVVDGQLLLAAGSELSGKVANVRPSRWLHRAGGFRLGFQQIAGVQGHPPVEIAASLSALDPAEKRSLRVDPEGAISAGPQSKGKMLLQLGVSYVTGKVLDDLMEEGIKAGLGAAAAGTAATAARYTSLAVGATLFVLQRGRDAALPEYSEIEITLSRPVRLEATEAR